MRKILLISVSLFFLITLVACGDGSKTDAEKVSEDITALTVETSAESDLQLKDSGDNETVISWSSSDEDVITNDGKVYRYKENKVVTLTATVTLNQESDTKEFIVTVPKLDNINNVSDVLSASDNSSVKVLGTVIGLDKEGIHIFDETGIVYVKSTDSTLKIADKVLISGTKTTDSNQPFINECTLVNTYPKGDTPLVPTKKVLGYYATLDHTKVSSYYQYFEVDGTINIIDDEIYVIDGNIKLKVDSNILDDIKTTLSDNDYARVTIKGFMQNHDGDNWVINISKLEDIVIVNLNDAQKLGQIKKWIESQLPDTPTDDLNLPVTHPVYGGTIDWASNNEDIITDTGIVNLPYRGAQVELTYSISVGDQFQMYTKTFVIESNVSNVSDIVTLENYNTAKENWNALGVYYFTGKRFNIEGTIASKSDFYLVIKDLYSEDYIRLEHRVLEDINKYQEGDNVLFANLKLKTEGNNFRLYSGKFIEKSNGNNPATYNEMTSSEYFSLDPNSLSTYNQMIKVIDVFVCRATSTLAFPSIQSCDIENNTAPATIIYGELLDYGEDSDYHLNKVNNNIISIKGIVDSFNFEHEMFRFKVTEDVEPTILTNEQKLDLINQVYDNAYARASMSLSIGKSDASYDVGYFNPIINGVKFTTSIELLGDEEFYTKYLKTGPLDTIKDEDGNDITPGHVYMEEYDSGVNIKFVNSPEGEPDFSFTIKITVQLTDNDGNNIEGATRVIEYEKVVKAGKIEVGVSPL